MTTTSDFKKYTEAVSEFDMATEAKMDATANMTTEAATASVVEDPPTNLDVNGLGEGGAISDSDAVASEEAKSDGAPATTELVTIGGQVNITGSVNFTARVDPNGRVTITGKMNLNGLANLDGRIELDGQVKLSGEADITGKLVPANLLRRLSRELRMRIFDLVMADGVPGAPDPIPGEEQFTRTLKLPNLVMVDRQTRDEVLGPLLHGKQFSVQLPRDVCMIDRLETLQERVMNRHRGMQFDPDEILEDMKEHARKTENEFREYLATTDDLNLCPFQYVGSLIVTYNGRVRLNVDDGTSNWSPRSLLVGFRCYDEAGFENWQICSNKRKQLNADGDLDWRDFRRVRKAFVAALIKNEDWFSYVPYNDVLLHPMIQHLVKALCMFGSGQKKPLRWVEVIAFEFIDIPQGLGVEWSYLSYGEAVYQSEPDDGFGGFPDGRFLSGDDDSRNSSEKESSAGEGEEDDEDEDEKSSDCADKSEDGDSCEGQENLGDVKSGDDDTNQEEAASASEEARENPACGDELQGDKS